MGEVKLYWPRVENHNKWFERGKSNRKVPSTASTIWMQYNRAQYNCIGNDAERRYSGAMVEHVLGRRQVGTVVTFSQKDYIVI